MILILLYIDNDDIDGELVQCPLVTLKLNEQTVTPSDKVVTQSTQQAESFTLFITH